jgi:uncharacterized protein YbjT (DUF2867 family)
MIFVTEAGGNVGRAIVDDLRQRGMAYRIGVRTGGRLLGLKGCLRNP